MTVKQADPNANRTRSRASYALLRIGWVALVAVSAVVAYVVLVIVGR